MPSTHHNRKPLLECHDVGKHFGPVIANHGINLHVDRGEILAILGENGAGKSTLMSIIAGRYTPDEGYLKVRGETVSFSSPAQALSHGVGMVYQRFMLIASLTVAENILLAATGSGQKRTLTEVKREIVSLGKLYGLDIEPDHRVATLSMGERQRAEILKLLIQSAELLIFDEPTAMLAQPDIERFFAIIRKLKNDGKGIIFITHKLEEVLAIADRIAILRQGEIVSETNLDKMCSKQDLARLMMGRDISRKFEKKNSATGEIIFSSDGLTGISSTGLPPFSDISFTVKRGEILSIIGVAGNGQNELCRTVAGDIAPASGEISYLGSKYSRENWTKRINLDIGYVPEDRHSVGSIGAMDLRENYLLTRLHQTVSGFLLDKGQMERDVDNAIHSYGIVAHSNRTLAGQLSGGNLQKLILARELAKEPSLFIAEQPTQGLDIAATEDVWRAILAQRKKSAILLFTGDVGEALSLSDMVAVIFAGKILEIVDAKDPDAADRIGMLMAGVREDHGVQA